MKDLLEVFADLWRYVKETRKIYLSLLVALLLLLGAVVVLTEGSAVMPFIYTLF